MTISYLDSRRLQGLSSDTKPTNVEANSIFIETDTGIMAWYNGSVWLPTYTTDFSSSTGWTSTDSGLHNIGSGAYNFQTAGVAGMSYNLGSVSNSDWVIRYKLTYTTAGSTSLGIFFMHLSTNTATAQTAHTGLGWFHYDNDNQGGLLTNLNTRPDSSPDGDYYRFNFSPSVSTHWIELKRVGTTTLTINVYDNSNYSGTPLYTKSKTDVSPSITGLQYIKFLGYTTGNMVGTVDDLKFWNGVSSV
jgi:hypothetical protein